MSLAHGATAAARVIGETFPIAEKDASVELLAKVKQADWKALMNRSPQTYAAYIGAHLPNATQNVDRLFDPTYSLPRAIVDSRGRELYPVGYRVNALAQLGVTTSRRYIVIGPEQSHWKWLTEVVKPTDQDRVLLARGNVFDLRQKTRRNVFRLDERFIERFGVRSVPAIVTQAGTMFRVQEFVLTTKNVKP